MSMIFPPIYNWSKRQGLAAIRATADRLRRELDARDHRDRARLEQADLFGDAPAQVRPTTRKGPRRHML